MFPSRRSLFHGAGLSSLAALWPFSKIAAAGEKRQASMKNLAFGP